MLKITSAVAAGLWLVSGVSFAGVDVNVNIGHPAPQVRVIEQQTIVVKEKKDNGKHLGQHKEKGGKKKKKK